MAKFENHIPVILANEGGSRYSDESGDPGNFVNGVLVGSRYGVTPVAYWTEFGRFPTAAEMRNLPEAQARQVYKSQFWDKIGGDSLPESQMTTAIFDFYVNSPKGAGVVLQTLLNAAGQSLKVDGSIGPNTRNALSHVTGAGIDIYNDYREGRLAFYAWKGGKSTPPEWATVFQDNGIAKGNSPFYQGWVNRVNNSFPVRAQVQPGVYRGTPLPEVNARASREVWMRIGLQVSAVLLGAALVAYALTWLRRTYLTAKAA